MQRILLGLFALLLASCSATSKRFSFYPNPAEAVVFAEGAEEPIARVLISIPSGIREEDVNRMRVQLRVENRTATALELPLERCLLVGSDLIGFGAPRLESESTVVAANETGYIAMTFPYPAGVPLDAPQLTGVNLQWVLVSSEGEWETSLSLDRDTDRRQYGTFYNNDLYYFGPGWRTRRPGWGLGVGLGFGW